MNIHDITKQIRAFADQLDAAKPKNPHPETCGRLDCKVAVTHYEATHPQCSACDAAPVDPYADLKAAHAAGKVIQAISDDGDWKDLCCHPPFWNLAVSLYRIKPDAPPFQLPPPPPGMQWHRVDAWKAEDLPPGTRPMTGDEFAQDGDEYRWGDSDTWVAERGKSGMSCAEKPAMCFRTTRPLVFTHEGKQWTWHRPGDPMPCDGGRKVEALCHYRHSSLTIPIGCAAAGILCWGKNSAIIGWRYAGEAKPEPLTKKVELGPEDCPPGSVFRPKSWKGTSSYITLASVRQMMVCLNCIDLDKTECDQANGSAVSWAILREMWLINRPRHRDADGNPTLWEKCSKEVPA